MSGLIKVDWKPDSRKLRIFGAGLVVIALAMAGLAHFKGHMTPARETIAAAFVLLGAATLAHAPAGKAIYKVWMSAAFVIGLLVSNLILLILYYGVITPMGLAMRLFGRDALKLRRPKASSYWGPVAVPETPEYFERLS